jgi:hypothetical protein
VVAAAALGLAAFGWLLGHKDAQAAIIGPTDDRFELSKVPGLEDIGFGRVDAQQAMVCTGAIVCIDKLPNRVTIFRGSAASVSSAKQIVTAAHLFYDPATRQPRASLQSCTFRNYASPGASIPIVVTPALRAQLRQNNPYENRWHDWAVVRLKSAIPNCKPYEADRSAEPVAPGTQVLAISHLHKDMMKRFSGREPIGQRCTIRNVAGSETPMYLTDCDAERGGSGGLGLIRRDGKWVAKAMMVLMGNWSANHADYDVAKNNITFYLGIEGDFLRALGGEPRPMPAVSADSGFPPVVDLDDRSGAGH